MQDEDKMKGQLITELVEMRRRVAELEAADTERRRVEEALLTAEAEAQRRLKEQTALREAGAVISSALDLETVLSRIAEQMGQAIDATSAFISQHESETMTSTVMAEYIGPQACARELVPDLGVTYPYEEDDIEFLRAMEAGRYDISQLDDPDLPESDRAHMEEYGAKTILYIPLRIGGRLVGYAELWESRRRREFTSEEIALCQGIAQQAAIAIENARLFAEVKQRAAELSTMLEAARAVSSTLDLEEVLILIAEQMAKAIGVTGCILSRWDREADAVVTLAEWRQWRTGRTDEPGTGYALDDFPATRAVLENRQPMTVLASDPDADLAEVALMRQVGVTSLLMLPLVVGERVIGLVELDETASERKFTAAEIRLCQALADQASIAIENARLFEEIEKRRLYLEGVLAAAPDAIVALNAHHRVVEWNSGAEKLFGYSQGEVIGRSINDLIIKPDVFEESVGFSQIAMGGGEVPPVETARYRRDGSSVDVILAASPILVGDEVIGTVVVYTDITERKRMEDALRTMSLVDELTGLYNRRGFFNLAEQQLKVSDRTKRRMMLLFADFDGLKRINDAFGHPEGDRALIEVADDLKETFRESDIVARIGGDEFVVLAIETDGVGTEILVTRLWKNLEARNARGGHCYKLSLSMGIARYDPEHPCSIDELLTQADRAMYEQKRNNQKA